MVPTDQISRPRQNNVISEQICRYRILIIAVERLAGRVNILVIGCIIAIKSIRSIYRRSLTATAARARLLR